MPDRQVLRFAMPGRQVLRTTDLPRFQAVSAGGTWQHGAEVYQWRPRRVQLFARREEVPLGAVVASTDVRTSKDDADLSPEDGLAL